LRFGVHIRMDRGLLRSLDYARELKCEAAQLFSGNPNGWARKPLDRHVAAQFKAKAAELDIRPIILHTPYLVNLASPDDAVWIKSTEALADAVWRAPFLGASIVVTHIGSHKGSGYDAGVARIREAVKRALDAGPDAAVALELGSGAGNSIGSSFEHIADILAGLRSANDRVCVCIDTAHLWGAGYDISTANGVGRLFEELDHHVGLSRLRLVHLNDTQVELGSHRDRHYHVGKGCIGIEGFRAIVNAPGTQNLPGIIETPGHDIAHDAENLATLRRLRQG
jgi:deoxyribonuclease-4